MAQLPLNHWDALRVRIDRGEYIPDDELAVAIRLHGLPDDVRMYVVHRLEKQHHRLGGGTKTTERQRHAGFARTRDLWNRVNLMTARFQLDGMKNASTRAYEQVALHFGTLTTKGARAWDRATEPERRDLLRRRGQLLRKKLEKLRRDLRTADQYDATPVAVFRTLLRPKVE